MPLTFTIERDDDGQILVAYLKIADTPIARTVEIEHGSVIVDEAADGSMVGIEFICPKHIRLQLKDVAERYHLPELEQAVDELFAVC